MKKTLDLVAYYPPTPSYNKAKYKTVGLLFVEDDGRISMRLDLLPVGPGWQGWLNAYPHKQSGEHEPPPAPVRVGVGSFDPPTDDDIPF